MNARKNNAFLQMNALIMYALLCMNTWTLLHGYSHVSWYRCSMWYWLASWNTSGKTTGTINTMIYCKHIIVSYHCQHIIKTIINKQLQVSQPCQPQKNTLMTIYYMDSDIYVHNCKKHSEIPLVQLLTICMEDCVQKQSKNCLSSWYHSYLV